MYKFKYFTGLENELDEKYGNENPIDFEGLEKPIFKIEFNDIQAITQNIHIQHLERVFLNKTNLLHLNFSWAMFYYERGIPDEEWYKSPGDGGQSIEYFSKFSKDIHWENYYNYSYFTTYFFHEAFSALELLGHILNEIFRLNLQDRAINFNTSLNKIKNENEKLYMEIENIKSKSNYKELVDIRHNMVHNTSPIIISSGVKKSNNTTWFGTGEYTTSSIIKEKMKDFLQMINDIIHAIYFYEESK